MEEFLKDHESVRRIKQKYAQIETKKDGNAKEAAETIAEYCERCLAIIDRLTDLNDGRAMPEYLSMKLGVEFEGFSDVRARIEEIRRYADAVQDFAEDAMDTPKDLESNGREVREMYLNLYTVLVMVSPRCGLCDRFAIA